MPRAIAAEMGFDDERIEDVRAAALLHDIGKLDISREILYKAARLTPTEYEEMREHVTRGAALLEPVGGSLRRVLPIILTHHDRFDGTGYSDRSGEEIPLEAPHSRRGRRLRCDHQRSPIPQGEY